MRMVFKIFNLFVFGLTLLTWLSPAEAESRSILTIADFESYPNNLGGSVGVFGAAEPNWENKDVPHGWYYGELNPNFTKENVFNGGQSFMCANGYSKEKMRWAAFSLGLGKLVDTDSTPVKIESLDVTPYKYLIFWVKGEKGGERFTVAFRDGNAINDMPQTSLDPLPEGMSKKWQKVVVPLNRIADKIDLSKLDQVILEFGLNRENDEGNIFYIDDFYFAKGSRD